jgi:hypothetical protein
MRNITRDRVVRRINLVYHPAEKEENTGQKGSGWNQASKTSASTPGEVYHSS